MIEIRRYEGPRADLRHLFSEADDSESQIASYMELGELLVAITDSAIVGEALVTPIDEAGTFELKSLAVIESHRSKGIGAALVDAVAAHCRHRSGRRLVVATAAASIPALKFYQRLGFRIHQVIRDFYSAEKGYRPLELDGIPLRDEVILDRDIKGAD